MAQVYVRPFPTVDEGKWQVSTNGGSDPVWSHSGKELFYLNGANEMVSATIPTPPTFAALTQRVLFALPADIRNIPSRPLYDVSPDDRRFIMTRSVVGDGSRPLGQAPRQHLIVVSNFFEELRTKVKPK